MNIVNKLELKLENFAKCKFSCDSDTSVGVVYDYACALQSFALSKMKEAEEQKKAAEETKE